MQERLQALADADVGLREAAARSLGELGATEAVPDLCQRLASGPAVAGATRRNSPKMQEPCEALLEALGDIGQSNPDVLALINLYTEHERPIVRCSAFRALFQLTGEQHWAQRIIDLLSHPQLPVRRAALLDLGAIGWRTALEPLSSALVENSVKLIALRGLIENGTPGPGDPDDETVLKAMDDLL